MNGVNYDLLDSLIERDCICINDITCNGYHYDSDESKAKRREWEGQYNVNGGLVGFVVRGNYYVTPKVEYALHLLKRAGLRNTGITVPFGGVFEFPFKLGGNDLVDIYKSSYNPNTGKLDAADRVIHYYQTLVEQIGSFRTWDRLLQEAGKLPAGQTLTDQVMNFIVMPIVQDREGYNERAMARLADEYNIVLGDSGKTSGTR